MGGPAAGQARAGQGVGKVSPEVSPMEQRFRLAERGAQRSVEVWGFPVQLQGDQDLCQRLRGYLNEPVLRLSGAFDETTEERGTRVVALSPGSAGWLEGCLQRAAEALNLRLTEAPLSEG